MGELLFNVKTLLFALLANAFIAFGIMAFSSASFGHPFDFENLDSSFIINSTTDYTKEHTFDDVVYIGTGTSIPAECVGRGKDSIRCLSKLSKLPKVFYGGRQMSEKR